MCIRDSLDPEQRKSSEFVERFNARSLSKLMASTEWNQNQLLLICKSDQEINCQLALTFIEFLKKTNPEVDLAFGFIDETQNEIDQLFTDSHLSPRFYLINKQRRYRPEIFGKQFGYVSFVEWMNQVLFSKKEDFGIEFNEEQQDDLLLEIAKLRGDEEEIKSAVEQRRLCLLYTSPSPRDLSTSRMPSSA